LTFDPIVGFRLYLIQNLRMPGLIRATKRVTPSGVAASTHSTSSALIFPSVLDRLVSSSAGHDENDVSPSVSDIFFDLANSLYVGYRIKHERKVEEEDSVVTVKQYLESAGNVHTGGIVWETSYLLATYLLLTSNYSDTALQHPSITSASQETNRRKIVVEVGAGCGLLGLVLAASATRKNTRPSSTGSPPIYSKRKRKAAGPVDPVRLYQDHSSLSKMTPEQHLNGERQQQLVETTLERTLTEKVALEKYACRMEFILTETSVVVPQLVHNIGLNQQRFARHPAGPSVMVRAAALDWEFFERDAAAAGIEPHSCHHVVGTDVIFSPRFVIPLLQTLDFLLAFSQSDPADESAVPTIHLCVQIRCADSHEMFFRLAETRFKFRVQDLTSDALELCPWSRELDCLVYRLTRQSQDLADSPQATMC
jgi:Lysine methyltransferase